MVVNWRRVPADSAAKPASPFHPATSHIPPKPPTPMSNNEGWVHEQIQGAPLRLAVCARVCIYVCGGNGGLKKSRIVHTDDLDLDLDRICFSLSTRPGPSSTPRL